MVVLAEIALVVYVIVQQDQVCQTVSHYTMQYIIMEWALYQAYSAFESVLQRDIEEYYNDINVRDIVDLIQRDVSTCI